MPADSIEGNPLLYGEDEKDDHEDAIAFQHSVSLSRSQRKRTIKTGLLIISLALNFVSFVVFVFARNHLHGSSADCVPWRGTKPVYSPAEDVISYEEKKFSTFTQVSKYSGPPSKEVDAAWSELYYDYTVSAITPEQVSKMRNHTVPTREEDSKYLVGLDVFHQLHCLNMVRKALHPEIYGDPNGDFAPPRKGDEPPFDHIDHCINSIREALMCSADVTPNVTEFDPKSKRYQARLDVIHTCRDFSKIQEWAREVRPPRHSKGGGNHDAGSWEHHHHDTRARISS